MNGSEPKEAGAPGKPVESASADSKENAPESGPVGSRGLDGQSQLPRPTFSTFVLSLASSALVQLGEVPDPQTGVVREDLVLAKHSIDVLSMLQEKTAAGLDEEEARLLRGLLYELRMKFVIKK